jgi:hypothetical protein
MSKLFSNGQYRTTRQQFGLGSFLSLIFTGIIFIGAGFYFYNVERVNANWIRINGQVVGSTSSSTSSTGSPSNSPRLVYTPVVQYEVHNQQYRVTGSSGNSVAPSVGSQRQVAYNPSNPDDAKVVDSNVSKLVPLTLAATGIFILLAGTVVYISNILKARRLG